MTYIWLSASFLALAVNLSHTIFNIICLHPFLALLHACELFTIGDNFVTNISLKIKLESAEVANVKFESLWWVGAGGVGFDYCQTKFKSLLYISSNIRLKNPFWIFSYLWDFEYLPLFAYMFLEFEWHNSSSIVGWKQLWYAFLKK